jgi:putative membrane protein insertion efficiency factor
LRLETYLSTQPPSPGTNTRLSYSHEDSGGAQCVAAPPSEEPPSLDSLKRSFDLSSLPQDFSAATPKRVSAGLRRRAAPQRITMHGLLPAQRATTLTLGDHHASPFGECGAAQPSAPANPRSVSIESRQPSGRLGLVGEPPRGRGQSFIRHSPERTASPLSPAATVAASASGFMKFLILGLIRFYQACLSPVMPSACRFHPSCSAYAFEAVERWGVWRGGRLALARLIRCRPWSGSFGYDPVPEIEHVGCREHVVE